MEKQVMRDHRIITFHIFFCLSFFVLNIERSDAQNPVDDNYRKAVTLMEEAKWTEASSVLTSVISDHSQDAMKYYGPAFGLLHYHLGLCQMSQKKYKEAARQFEITYKNFPNKVADGIPNTRNHYHKNALYRWGTAEQGAEEYKGALKIYDKFISEKPEKGTYNGAELYINMGVCHARLGNVAEATDKIQKVYDNHDRLRERDKGMLHLAFFDLANQWIEKALPADGIAFMDKNDAPLRFSPYDSYKYKFNERTLKLAQDASSGEKNLDALALRFFTLVPRTEDVISELQDRMSFEKGDATRAKIQKEIDKYEAKISGGTTVDIAALRLLAFVYEKNSSFRAAYAVFDYMTRNYPIARSLDGKKDLHPDLVYNATRCAFSIGDLLSAQHHGMNFLKKYPGHELEPEVQSMLMEQLFRRGDYERCIEIAVSILPKLPEDSPQQDLCLFCLGGSYYYDGQYEEADEILEQHVKKYPKSGYLEESSYYRGANKVKLLNWAVASPLLEIWLKNYPQSSLRPFAILDRATCHFATDEMVKCLEKLDEIEQRHPGSDIYDRSLNLRGDVLQAQKEWPAAHESYVKGKSMAEKSGHYQVAAESLSQLVVVANSQEKYKEAADYYDEFVTSYPGNFLEPQVVANALEALIHESIGRGQEGLDKMESIIDQLGRQENADLEKAVAKYGNVSIKLFGEDKTIQKLKEMATKPGQPQAVLAWLLVSRVDILEKIKKDDPATATAEINTAFTELRSFDKKVLAPYVLARIGGFLRASNSTESVPWFNEIVERPGVEAKDFAYNALAKIYLKGTDVNKHELALKNIDWVIQNTGDNNIAGESAYERASYYSKRKQWPEAEKRWTEFTGNKKWAGANSPEAWYQLGKARDEQDKLPEALSAYVNVYGRYGSRIEYAIPAVARSAEIQNDLGEKEKAYRLAYVSGFKWAEYLNEYETEKAILRSIFVSLEGEFRKENDKDPYTN
ncbi:MAG: tetratricopeptide repeat protein [Verrucomicrobiales bacterium]|nr:tetratricopeptide repeat protein [Verrucomicrobiales bacterium]|tara:strand:- start:2855 stop:5761 length:2907 start_codon:yes stop_codon:yes gene_type:complete